MVRRLILTAVVFLLGAAAAHAEIYQWVDEKGGVHFSDQPPPPPRVAKAPGATTAERHAEATQPAAPERTVSPAATPAKPAASPQAPKRLPRPVDPAILEAVNSPIPMIRTMVRDRRFADLNALLEKRRVAALADVRREDDLVAAYNAFTIDDKDFEPLLDRWVAATPKAYQPYLARAEYFYGMSWSARGTSWSSETSDDQFEAMGEYLARAAKDYRATFEREERIIVPFASLVWMVDKSESPEPVLRVLAKGLSISPASFFVRASLLQSITPRWGGSYKVMAAIAEEAQRHVNENPKLAPLVGYVAYDQGDMQRIKKNYAEAERLMTEALSHGAMSRFFIGRARVRLEQEKLGGALEDANRAIEAWPHKGEYYHVRSVILARLKRLDEALRDADIADLLDPNDKDVARQLKHLADEYEVAGYKSQQLKDAQGAIANYSAAIHANPGNSQLYVRRARILAEQKKYDEALADLERARKIVPDQFDVYMLADWVLAQRKDWDRIIGWWDQFIARNPGHSRAYVERGGAHYHKGDLQAALRDAKKAADLGSEEGGKLYKRFAGSAAAAAAR